MNINIQIEQLVLQGTSLTLEQQASLRSALQTELAHLIATNGVPTHLQAGGAIARLPTSMNVTPRMNPTQLGQRLAHSIYGGLVY
jgi:hypothetical protein